MNKELEEMLSLREYISSLPKDHILIKYVVGVSDKEEIPANDFAATDYLNNIENGSQELPLLLTLAEFKKGMTYILGSMFSSGQEKISKWTWILDFFLKDLNVIDTGDVSFKGLIGLAIQDGLMTQEQAQNFCKRKLSLAEKYIGRQINVEDICWLR